MSDIVEALMWDGVRCMISVFAAHTGDETPSVDFRADATAPTRVRVFELVAEEGRRPERRVAEYDLTFDEVPPGLAGYLRVCLLRACSAETSVVAWLGFEGSFHFDHLLTEDVAHQIYGVCAGSGPPKLALEAEERRGDRWREVLRRHADAHLTRRGEQ
ncbi:hypothetical protein [Spongiactinospora sp. TRM90649]|uniref:hypothetical protein n=1 Tax=Spongiactinospora sp. TRM90649 TaxID=3031114 RepID=UPI0023F71E4A|nr:hypothetical protein [Spongiactinospora sp. TRM90649]MDF5757366.1 hypothetical protein [Spongiactinospora sp. TRM90649]